jgi:hypothetical protein
VSSRLCICSCKTPFYIIDITICRVEFKIGGAIGNGIRELLEIAFADLLDIIFVYCLIFLHFLVC